VDGVIVTSLRQIHNLQGDVFHAMKRNDDGFNGFGEAYFSTINQGDIKGWKKHTKMTLNLVVPIGEIEFVVFDKRTNNSFSIRLSQDNYKRLTVSPNLWVAFRGLGKYNMLLNIASIEHDSSEAININIDEINFNWV